MALIGNTDKIFREAPCDTSFSTYGDQYCGGRGVLARNLNKVNGDFTENLAATVIALWSTRDPINDQFQPSFTNYEDDLSYVSQFDELWNSQDQTTLWSFTLGITNLQEGVCQGIGMDFLGALIRFMN
jgi:hypothetical protein